MEADMQLTMMRSKIHNATITELELDYEGSIAIDADLIDAAGFLVYEQVDIFNKNNGERLTTYIIPAPRGSKKISLNGAAARLAYKGDRVIIVSYASMDAKEASKHKPVIVKLDDSNRIIK
jgi:aspartate 1-decarboxylase